MECIFACFCSTNDEVEIIYISHDWNLSLIPNNNKFVEKHSSQKYKY